MALEGSISLLEHHLESLITKTFLAFDLRNLDSSDSALLKAIDQDVKLMNKGLIDLRKVLESGHNELATTQALCRQVQELTNMAEHMSRYLPKAPTMIAPQLQNKILDEKENLAPVGNTQVSTNIQESIPSNSVIISVPLISPLSMDEYNTTPKYMLGRITHASLNRSIRDINEALKEKYRLMRKKRKDMTPQEIRTVQAFKKQENSESQGTYFILADDIKALGVADDGFNGRQFSAQLPVLRHHKRLREIRGGGLTRLAPI